MKYIYRIYQVLVFLPLGIITTLVMVLLVTIGCTFGNGHFWGYAPGHWWARIFLKLLLIPVKVEGREQLEKDQSYVFVANHQGAFDIFLIYGYLNRNFKWMMKHQLRNMPFIGYACEKSHQIFVDKRGPKKIKASYDAARNTLKDGISLTVFPEGARTFTGHMARFRRGAFALADELQLPVVPMTINGSFNVKPRTKDLNFVTRYPLTLTIHKPIYPSGKGPENVRMLMEKSYEEIQKGLVTEFQGYVENPDQ